MLAIAFAIAAAAVLGVLLLPVTIELEAGRPDPASAPDLGIQVGLALGVVGARASASGRQWRIRPVLFGWAVPCRGVTVGPRPPAGTPASAPGPEPLTRGAPAFRAAPAGGGWSSVRHGLELAGQPAWRLVSGLPRVLSLRRGCISGRFGLADPARTGQLWGALQALRACRWRRLRLDLQPDWTAAGLSGRGRVRLHFHLGLLLCLVARFAAGVGWRWAAHRFAAAGWRGRAAP